MKKGRLFLWDIDGTLLKAGGAGKLSLNKAFEEVMGISEIWTDLNPDGRTDEWIFEELHIKKFGSAIPTHLKQDLLNTYMDYLEAELPSSPHFKILPGVIDVLDGLKENPDHMIGLATGNLERAAYIKLKRGGLDHYFSFGGFGSDSVYRQALTQKALDRAIEKMGREPGEVYVIGDTIYDIRCGKGISAKTIAVCTGTTSEEVLQKEGPDFLIQDLTEFKKII